MPLEKGALYVIKGGVSTRLLDTSNSAQNITHVMVCPPASGVKLDPSDSYKEIEGVDCSANKVVELKYLEKSSLNLTLEFGNSTMELKALAMGQRMALKSTDTAVPYGVAWVNAPDTATPTLPASAAGVYGQGVAADAVATGAVMINGVSEQLTQLAFGSFDFASIKSFAIGSDGAMKFSADLRGKLVSIGGALHTIANVYDTEGADRVSQLRVQHNFIDNNRLLSIFEADISLERSGIDFNAPNQSMKGLVNSGQWRVRTLPRVNRC